jgi:hypothetical protein
MEQDNFLKYPIIRKINDDPSPSDQYFEVFIKEYFWNMILYANSIITCLTRIIGINYGDLPAHGMLGALLNDKKYKDLFLKTLGRAHFEDLNQFNKFYNQVKHGLILMSPESITNPSTILLYDVRERKELKITKEMQKNNIDLAKKIMKTFSDPT